jgi:hypothetical protein
MFKFLEIQKTPSGYSVSPTSILKLVTLENGAMNVFPSREIIVKISADGRDIRFGRQIVTLQILNAVNQATGSSNFVYPICIFKGEETSMNYKQNTSSIINNLQSLKENGITLFQVDFKVTILFIADWKTYSLFVKQINHHDFCIFGNTTHNYRMSNEPSISRDSFKSLLNLPLSVHSICLLYALMRSCTFLVTLLTEIKNPTFSTNLKNFLANEKIILDRMILKNVKKKIYSEIEQIFFCNYILIYIRTQRSLEVIQERKEIEVPPTNEIILHDLLTKNFFDKEFKEIKSLFRKRKKKEKSKQKPTSKSTRFEYIEKQSTISNVEILENTFSIVDNETESDEEGKEKIENQNLNKNVSLSDLYIENWVNASERNNSINLNVDWKRIQQILSPSSNHPDVDMGPILEKNILNENVTNYIHRINPEIIHFHSLSRLVEKVKDFPTKISTPKENNFLLFLEKKILSDKVNNRVTKLLVTINQNLNCGSDQSNYTSATTLELTNQIVPQTSGVEEEFTDNNSFNFMLPWLDNSCHLDTILSILAIPFKRDYFNPLYGETLPNDFQELLEKSFSDHISIKNLKKSFWLSHDRISYGDFHSPAIWVELIQDFTSKILKKYECSDCQRKWDEEKFVKSYDIWLFKNFQLKNESQDWNLKSEITRSKCECNSENYQFVWSFLEQPRFIFKKMERNQPHAYLTELQINSCHYSLLGEIYFKDSHFCSKLYFEGDVVIHDGQKNNGLPFHSNESTFGFLEFLVYIQKETTDSIL